MWFDACWLSASGKDGMSALNLREPDDLSVVGYDHSTLIAFPDASMTIVRQSVQAMSEAAVRAPPDQNDGDPVARGRAHLPDRPEPGRVGRARSHR